MLRQVARRLCRLGLSPGSSPAQPWPAGCIAQTATMAPDVPCTSGRTQPQPFLRQFSAMSAQQMVDDGLIIDDSAVQRLKQLQSRTPDQPVMLRVEVEGGGCSGFQYRFRIDNAIQPDDRVFEKGGAQVVVDTVSLGFLKGAKVEFEDNLMRSAFQIAANPNSEATCGCGSSFVAKI